MYIKSKIYKQFDSLEIKETEFNEFVLPDHFHDKYCIGLLTKGIKNTVIEGNHYTIHSNTVSIINPYQVHSDQNYDQDASVFRMIYINKDVINYFGNRLTGRNINEYLFTNNLINDPAVSIAISKLFTEVNNENLLEVKLQSLIEHLISKYKNESTYINKIEDFNAVKESIEYARLHFDEKINIDDMAKKCRLSKFQFIRYFKKLTGLTPAAYMIICRFNYAKSLIFKGYPLGQVALESGFYDHPQFCKYFRYFTGLAPAEYKSTCNIIQA